MSLLLTEGQSGQWMNLGVLSGGRQNPAAKRLLDIHADLVPLGILDGGKTVHPAPPEADAYLVIPPHTKSAGKRTLEALPYLALVVLDSSTHGPEML